ncbi:MAG: Asp-tRNA(Asn)/Glu-tRNA(Gln) amidotransferase subunit GatA [Treponemataceae bacterium]
MNELTIRQIRKKLYDGSMTCHDLLQSYQSAYEADAQTDKALNGFIEFFCDALTKALEVDALISEARSSGTLAQLFTQKPLLGIPFGIKDNISVQGKACTCGSSILESYVAPYNATVTQRLIDAGAIPLGRANMDEFAMGSSTEYSCYGITRNPINKDYTPGGSSGGSAAVVAGFQAPFALGTETGGSVRLPASYCGLYGYKPTYGTLSRWGVVAFGSSLDQVGIVGKEPSDIALPLAVMAGSDFYDDTTHDTPVNNCATLAKNIDGSIESLSLKGLKIAIPKQFDTLEGLDEQVKNVFDTARDWFISQGAIVESVEIPVLNASIACYYVIALSEAASNLSRFDGIRYGKRVDPKEGYDELYVATRSDGFGSEVKRRIIIGNYVLSSELSGDCYKKGMSVRAKIQKEITALFTQYDIILSPTCPTPPFKLGERVDDPLAMYLSDLFTTFANLARTPALSMPAGTTKDGLPIGIQIAGGHLSDEKLLQIAQTWHQSHLTEGKK